MDLHVLAHVAGGGDLTLEQMRGVIASIMGGEWRDEQIAVLLAALRAKGETAEELAGAALAMREHMTRIHSRRPELLDTCGTGGDGSGTFNISTAAALVAAAAGVPVAKHGNRRVTSKSGSADVLAELGVRVDASLPIVEKCLDELGVCFCFAASHHPAMRRVAEVRRQLGFRTIFNLLGPLSNPAGAVWQLLGVGQQETRLRVAGALRLLGVRRGAVVTGLDGLDEVTLSGPTAVSLVTSAGIEELRWTPADFGLEESDREALRAETPTESAAMIRNVLAGQPGPPRDIVVLNAAAAIWTAEQAATPRLAAERAARAIDSGEARRLLERLAEVSHS